MSSTDGGAVLALISLSELDAGDRHEGLHPPQLPRRCVKRMFVEEVPPGFELLVLERDHELDVLDCLPFGLHQRAEVRCSRLVESLS